LSPGLVIAIVRAEFLLPIVFVPMAVEAWRARANERTQRARGGIEPSGDVYTQMSFVYPLAFASMIGESYARGPAVSRTVIAGALIFVVAKALKWWAIVSLGRSWTFRVIVVPGGTRVTRGPYRFLSHPNYLAVVGEFVGVAMMADARVAGTIATLVFAGLMMKRIRVERSTLDAILPPG
jgi:methyltransferase